MWKKELTLAKLGSLLVKRLAKPYKDFMLPLDTTVSSFSGRGKVSALKLVMKWGRLQKAMEGLGKAWILSEELFTLLQKFVCKMYMYASQTSLCNVNDFRY